MSMSPSDLELHYSMAVFEKLQLSAAFLYLDLYFILEVNKKKAVISYGK